MLQRPGPPPYRRVCIEVLEWHRHTYMGYSYFCFQIAAGGGDVEQGSRSSNTLPIHGYPIAHHSDRARG